MRDFLQITRGTAPLIVSFPHTGTEIPADLLPHYVSPWQATRDTDWWIDQLYDFAKDLGATTLRTTINRSVIDVNRDPSGVSLYPGQATTELCPTTDFDGASLYLAGQAPQESEIARRRETYFAPYHAALTQEIARLRKVHEKIVLYDAHSIRSHIPRLFEGELPQFNFGTNSGASCNPALAATIELHCAASGESHITNGRFKGGYITRNNGAPHQGVHAVQMELSCRGYMDEPAVINEHTWPTPYHPQRAAKIRDTLNKILNACLEFVAS